MSCHRRAWSAVVLALFVLAARTGMAAPKDPPQGSPNVILISIDSLRPDHLGCYGYQRATSPHIDELARQGALFQTVVSSTSWTLPAHAAMLTGLPDRVHGCIEDRRWLDGSRRTLAEAFRDAGYHTAGFFSAPYLHPCFGFSQGFDRYEDCTSYSAEFVRRVQAGHILNEQGVIDRDLRELSHRDVTNPIVLQAVTKWLDERAAAPFFLFIHLFDVHYDYVPPPPYDTMFDPDYTGTVDGRNPGAPEANTKKWTPRDLEHVKALYDGEIRSTDETLAAILDELGRRGFRDRTIIAVTADHGEAFNEHGFYTHRRSLYEEEIRIPLILHYPAVIPAGRRIPQLAGIVDIAPTLLELAGAPPLPDAMGRSLAPLLKGPPPAWSEVPVLSELLVPGSHVHKFAVRESRWKSIHDLQMNRVQLFDLQTDPEEHSSLLRGNSMRQGSPFSAGQVNQRYERAAKELDEAASRQPPLGEPDTPPISKMTVEQLRALGYLK